MSLYESLLSLYNCIEVEHVSNLVNRERKTFSIKNELVKGLEKLSDSTRIPQSRLVDEALEDLLRKYEKKA